jgi:hypothetical protein
MKQNKELTQLILCLAESFALAAAGVPVPFLGGTTLLTTNQKHNPCTAKHRRQIKRVLSKRIGKESNTMRGKLHIFNYFTLSKQGDAP